MLFAICCTLLAAVFSLLLYYQYFIRTHLKAIKFSYDAIPVSLENAVVYVSDPHSCYWCLRQAENFAGEASDFLQFKSFSFNRLTVQNGIALARRNKLNHFSGFPVTLVFDSAGNEVKRLYGVFGVQKLI